MLIQNNLNAEVIEAAGGILWRNNRGYREVALIHRPKYNDWTLPKGKREPGESWQETALREVFEETGCRARLDSFAGSLSYPVGGVAKIILFWNMAVNEFSLFTPNHEVDELVWAPFEEAIQLLTYEGEKNLLAHQLPHAQL
jgi:8-oxo-dGTP diphosphatase